MRNIFDNRNNNQNHNHNNLVSGLADTSGTVGRQEETSLTTLSISALIYGSGFGVEDLGFLGLELRCVLDGSRNIVSQRLELP